MKYIKAFQVSMQNMLEYRSDFLFQLLSRFFPVIIQLFMWTAIFQASPETVVMGYTYSQMITYTILSVFITSMLNVDAHYRIADDIKNGMLSKYLILPLDYYAYQAAGFLGGKISELAVLGIGIVVLCIIMQAMGFFVATALGVLAFAVLLLLVMVLQFVMYYCLACLAFWFGECGGVFTVVSVIARIISGAVFPLDIFGSLAVNISKLLPFYYTTYFLTNTLLGKNNWGEILLGTGALTCWILILYGLGRLLWARGQKRYIAAGG